jgi:hypothetical protein
LRFFAIFDGRNGYAHDYYPEERAEDLRYFGRKVIGDFATAEEAFEAAKVRADCDRPQRPPRSPPLQSRCDAWLVDVGGPGRYGEDLQAQAKRGAKYERHDGVAPPAPVWRRVDVIPLTHRASIRILPDEWRTVAKGY